MVNSIIILAVIVLPGWISVTAAQRHHPRVVEQTALMVWGMMFYHAAVVHAIGVGTAAALTLIWRGYFLDTLGLDRVLTEGALEFARDSPGTAFAVFGAYFLWTVIGSAISGVVDAPSRLTSAIGAVAQMARLAPEPVEEESIWHSALNYLAQRAKYRGEAVGKIQRSGVRPNEKRGCIYWKLAVISDLARFGGV